MPPRLPLDLKGRLGAKIEFRYSGWELTCAKASVDGPRDVQVVPRDDNRTRSLSAASTLLPPKAALPVDSVHVNKQVYDHALVESGWKPVQSEFKAQGENERRGSSRAFRRVLSPIVSFAHISCICILYSRQALVAFGHATRYTLILASSLSTGVSHPNA